MLPWAVYIFSRWDSITEILCFLEYCLPRSERTLRPRMIMNGCGLTFIVVRNMHLHLTMEHPSHPIAASGSRLLLLDHQKRYKHSRLQTSCSPTMARGTTISGALMVSSIALIRRAIQAWSRVSSGTRTSSNRHCLSAEYNFFYFYTSSSFFAFLPYIHWIGFVSPIFDYLVPRIY